MGFFSTVKYDAYLQDSSWCSKCEAAADICRKPTRWVANAFSTKAGSIYEVSLIDDKFSGRQLKLPDLHGARHVIRVAIGVALCIFGEIAALPLMGVAFLSQEIRLKHKFAQIGLNAKDLDTLHSLVANRQRLAAERKGCEPVSCMALSMCSILYLLCFAVCCKN